MSLTQKAKLDSANLADCTNKGWLVPSTMAVEDAAWSGGTDALSSPLAEIRSRSADVFRLWPELPGAERVAGVLAAWPEGNLNAADPLQPRRFLDQPLSETAKGVTAPIFRVVDEGAIQQSQTLNTPAFARCLRFRPVPSLSPGAFAFARCLRLRLRLRFRAQAPFAASATFPNCD